MNLKSILLSLVLILLVFKASKNIYLLADFEFLKGESISYSLGALTGKIINILAVFALIKLCFDYIKPIKADC